MFRKYGLPIIALIGLVFCGLMIHIGLQKPPVNHIFFSPPTSPYKNYIVGEGIIESAYKNIQVAPAYNDLITDIYCQVGQIVKKNDNLFKLDTRLLDAQLAKAVDEQRVAEVDYKNQEIQFSYYKNLRDKSAVSKQAYTTAFYNMELAKQKLNVAISSVNLVKEQIERAFTRAPIDGEILQVNIRVGQYGNANPYNNQPLILFGDTSIYHLRIDIDEEDSWRVINGSRATAFVRGNSKIFIPLEFVYAEPFVTPKTSLSGADTERVDTRVLQLVYKFSKNQYPVYVGQMLDVYIESKPSEAE